MMNAPLRPVDVDRLAALARAEAPAPLRVGEAARMIEAAMAAAAERAPAQRRSRMRVIAAAVVAAAAGAVLAAIVLRAGSSSERRADARQVIEQPAQMTLPSGERLTATVGAVYVVKVSDGVTTVVVYEGTVLVVGGAASTEVKAGHAWVSTVDVVTAEEIREEPVEKPVPAGEPPSLTLPPPGGGLLENADRLRAKGRIAEAARAYEVAAAKLRGDQAAIAGYQAAYLYARRLDDAQAALRVLDASGADRPGAPLEERALVLRITILEGSGGDATDAIARYLDRFPAGDWASTLRSRAP